MSQSKLSFNVLLDEDASRLPCGALEKLVFSTDRRKLLSSTNYSDETKGNDDNTTERTTREKALFVTGSENEYYYTMLQIENEIEKESLKNAMDPPKLKELQKEFDEWIQKVNKKWNGSYHNEIPHKIHNLIFRNRCRGIMCDDIDKQSQCIDEIEKSLKINYDYSAPSDVTKGVFTSNTTKRNHKEYIAEHELKHILESQMTLSLHGYNNEYIHNHYHDAALLWLMQQRLNLKQKRNIITNYYHKLLLLGGGKNKANEETIMEMILDDLNAQESTKYLKFNHRSIHSQLTLKQLDKLKETKPELLNVSAFVELYLKKLMPLELGEYIGKDWKNEIPMHLKWKYICALYQYAIRYSVSTNIGCYIYYQYIVFMERYYHIMKIYDAPYDFEVIIKYIMIPKSTHYNSEYCSKWSLSHNNEEWGGDHKMIYKHSYSFLSQFNDIPLHNHPCDCALFERFFAFLFSPKGHKYWMQFVENKANIKSKNVLDFIHISSSDSNSIIKTFGAYINIEFLEKQRLLSRIHNAMELDTLDKNIKRCKTLHVLDNKVCIELDVYKNPSNFSIKDMVKLYVNVRNINDLSVKIFEINTASYYRDKNEEISTDLNLDGLSSSFEWILTNKDMDLKHSYHKKQIVIDFPSQLNGKRGVYFVDLLSNGIHSRCVIKIGNIRFMERICEAGHLFQLLDEENKVIKDASIIMSKHRYTTNNRNGKIFIPFTTVPAQTNIILERSDDAKFNVLTSFNHEKESYSIQCGIYVDREQLLEKKRATVIVRSALFLNGNRISCRLLQNIKLSIKIKTGDAVHIHKLFNNFKLYDNRESVAIFTVPNEPRSICIHLQAQVKNFSQNITETLSKSVLFKINSIDNTSNIAQLFLIPNYNNAYSIGLYGKNGEGIANKDIECKLTSKYHKSLNTFTLTTDENGRIYLPSNLNESYIRLQACCHSVDRIRCEWDLNDGINHSDTPNIIHMTTNSSVSIPYFPRLKHNIFGLFDKYYIHAYHDDDDHLMYDKENGYIVISNLPPGSFILKGLDLDHDINIYVTTYGKMVGRKYNVNKKEIVQLSPTKPLQISSIEETQDEKEHQPMLRIQLNGVNEQTRVHIIATHMISRFSIYEYLHCIYPSLLSSKQTMARCTNFYVPQRMIGEELRYILERQKAKTFIGNSLIRPSFLVKPLQHKTTSNLIKTAKKGTAMRRRLIDNRTESMQQLKRVSTKSAHSPNSPGSSSHQLPNEDKYNIEFIGKTSALITNQKPDISTGLLTVNISHLHRNQTFIRIIAFDQENCAIRTISLQPQNTQQNEAYYQCTEYKYLDIRLNPGLDPKHQYVDTRNIILLNKKNKAYTLSDFKTSEIETYSDFSELFNLIQTVSKNGTLKDFIFLTKWNQLSQHQKLQKYDTYFCHELHLFLSRKDPEFFGKVCVPFISSKLNKDFMDYCLLNNDEHLLSYCNLENLLKLNPLEQILLALHFKDKNHTLSQVLFKYFTQKDKSMRINPEQFDKLFRTALATKAMDDTVSTKQKMYSAHHIPPPTGGAPPAPPHPPLSLQEQMKSVLSRRGTRGRRRGGSRGRGRGRSQLLGGIRCGSSLRKTAEMEPIRNIMDDFREERKEIQKQALFKQMEETNEYQETYYHQIVYEEDTKHLIPLNKFWCSYAIHALNDDTNIAHSAFLSKWILFATSCINEILCALAVMDISCDDTDVTAQFKYGDHGNSVGIIASAPTIIFAKELLKKEMTNVLDVEQQSVSINLVYFDPNDRYRVDENGDRMDKFVHKNDFRPGKIYGALSILTNVSSITQNIKILCQIPSGSIPVHRGFRTKTFFITLSAYSVHKFEFYFYFPSIGRFRHYPVVVTKGERVIGSSKKSENDTCTIMVKHQDKNRKLDTQNWSDVSLNGSNHDILEYLYQNNINNLQLSNIYYKLKNKQFYDNLIELLEDQFHYDDNIWKMQLFHFKQLVEKTKTAKTEQKHKYKQEIMERFNVVREYLAINIEKKLCPYFKSDCFEYDDIWNHKYNHLEYIPLVNARAHLLGQKREILNDALKAQYQQCLYRCSYRSTSVYDLKYNDILSLLYYLLLQDRIEESLNLYCIIKKDTKLYEEIQHEVPVLFDYFEAYMALFVDDDDEQNMDKAIATASDIAAKYRNALLISSKRKLFEDIEVLLTDLDYKREDEDDDKEDAVDGIGDRDRKMNELSDKAPSLDFTIDKTQRKLIISHQNITTCHINFYMINTEILFSNSPFLKENNSNNSAFGYIAPNQTISIDLNIKHDTTAYMIPTDLKNKNVFIEIISSTLNVSKPFYDHELNVSIKEEYAQLKVTVPSQNKNKFVPKQKAYIKVYCQNNRGVNQFYKDGYTDIRGRFDYASISTNQLNETQKFAIFVNAPGHGSIVKEALPPKR